MKRPSPTGSSRPLQVFVLLACIVAVPVALELVARLLQWQQQRPSLDAFAVPDAFVRDRAPGSGFAMPVDASVVPDEDLLWRNRPSIKRTEPVVPFSAAVTGQWTLRLDSRGLRGDEVSATPAAGVFRILCLGDSVTQGFNVDQGSDWPALLSRMLATRYPSLHFEVLNAAVPQWSWVQGARFLFRDGFRLQPALVISAFGTSDQLEPVAVSDSEQMWLSENLRDEPRGTFSALLASSRAARLLAPEARSHSGSRGPSPGCLLQQASGTDCHRVSPPEIAATVHRIGETARAAAVDSLFVNLDFAATPAAAALRSATLRDGFAFVDAVEAIRAEWLRADIRRSHRLGLLYAHVPIVPFGRPEFPAPQGRGPLIRFRTQLAIGSSEVHVKGEGEIGSGFRFDAPMHDDGDDGDERAADGVFTAAVETPPSTSSLHYMFYAGGRPEFAVPTQLAASNAERVLRFNRDSDAAVQPFGERYLMSDALHPDAAGQQKIAEAVFAQVLQAPSLQRAAAAARP
ncbi:MAG TPA: GDSL-type esterase/lipase family protein [Candidatus Binatia bacterium]|jgi:lysophospholipase L1-like esterase